MKYRRKTNKIACIVSSLFMALTLVWLTVSLPVVNGARQKAMNIENSTTAASTSSGENNTGEDDNSFANNTTEEKTPNSTTLSEEYLHDTNSTDNSITVPSTEYKVEHASTYIAFHGELICPPPDAC